MKAKTEKFRSELNSMIRPKFKTHWTKKAKRKYKFA